MLKINLLTERRDAEKQYYKMMKLRLNLPHWKKDPNLFVVDHLAMHLDRTVRRRTHQNIRNGKKRLDRIKKRVELGMTSRTGISAIELLGRTQGQPNRDVEVGKKKPVGKDRGNKFSRCLHCGTEFVDERDRITPSSFAFCGETEKVGGKCKAAWLAVQPLPTPVEPRFTIVTPEDVDHQERQSSLRLGRSRLSATIKSDRKDTDPVKQVITKPSWEVAAARH